MNPNPNSSDNGFENRSEQNEVVSFIVLTENSFSPFNCKILKGNSNSITKSGNLSENNLIIEYTNESPLEHVIKKINDLGDSETSNSSLHYSLNKLRCDFYTESKKHKVKLLSHLSELSFEDFFAILQSTDLVIVKDFDNSITLFHRENIDLDELVSEVDQILFNNALNSVNFILNEYKDLLLGYKNSMEDFEKDNMAQPFLDGTLSIEDICELNENLIYLKKNLSKPHFQLGDEEIQLLCETCLLTDYIHEHNSSFTKIKLCSGKISDCDRSNDCEGCGSIQ